MQTACKKVWTVIQIDFHCTIFENIIITLNIIILKQ